MLLPKEISKGFWPPYDSGHSVCSHTSPVSSMTAISLSAIFTIEGIASQSLISPNRTCSGRCSWNPWLNNVELVTAEKIGFETTTYVRNIFQDYVAYKLTLEAQEIQRQAREQITPAHR